MLKILNLFLLIIFNFLLSTGIASATDCAKVNRVDNRINFNDALSIFLGCEIPTKEKIEKLQNSSDVLIKNYFTKKYYSGLMQPSDISNWELIENVNISLSKKSLSAFFFMDWWVDTDAQVSNFDLKDYNISEKETYEIFELILAGESMINHEMDYSWAKDNIDNLQILFANKKIPYGSDALSYAYASGTGVKLNMETAIRYNELAVKTFPEAIRYKSSLLIDRGAPLAEILENLRKAADMNYISAIEQLANNLFDYSLTLPKAEEEYSKLFSTLETLGYAGNMDMQFLIASSYDQGIGVFENDSTAIEWYEKAAKHGHSGSSSRLMTIAAEKGDYESYLVHSLTKSNWGFVETDGYLDAINAIHILNRPKKIKTIQFLLDHCMKNPNVSKEDIKICENYPIKHAAFKPNQDILLVANDPGAIKYKDNLDLATGKYHALLIGNQNYNYWSKLETPIQDIDAVSRKLISDYSFNAKVIKDASRKEILQSIYDLGSLAEFNDHVLVYYAGHGIVDTDTDEGYWIPSNADQSFRPDWVSNSEIKTALKSIKSKHLLVMADSCYSGTLVRSGTRLQNSMSNPLIKRLFSKKAKIAITSGGNEPVVDSISGSQNSVFANAFLDALENNSNTFVPASILFASIRDKVTKEANQTPLYSNIRELDDDGGEFVFKKTN